MRGIALKVTYNDGGSEQDSSFGFRGTCSNRTMLENVRERRMTNCSSDGKPCREYVDANFRGRPPTETFCYERHIFAKPRFEFGCGMYHNGPNEGQPIPIAGVSKGDIAFLTTLLPGRTGAERIIFAFFRISDQARFRKGWGYMLLSDGTMDIRLPDEVAMQLHFWRYFENRDDSQKWATGLFRKLDNERTDALIGDALSLLGDYPQLDVILRALGTEVRPRPVRRLPIAGNTRFGGGGFAGGESDAHRNLKKYVAAHPEKIGLPRGALPDIEFPYLSGDQVDIKFDLPDGSAALVEIETIDGRTGAHQCIKYRALLEAARGEPIGGGRVRAVLVAHQFDRETQAFAQAYGIKTFVLRV